MIANWHALNVKHGLCWETWIDPATGGMARLSFKRKPSIGIVECTFNVYDADSKLALSGVLPFQLAKTRKHKMEVSRLFVDLMFNNQAGFMPRVTSLRDSEIESSRGLHEPALPQGRAL